MGEAEGSKSEVQVEVCLVVNGNNVTAAVSPRLTLLDFLRENLKLAGTKNGCSQGHCGACTVIVDGKAVRSCLVKMSTLEGKRVETIEGLSKNGQLHPIQQAFLADHALQCGFCTPGMIMATKALLDSNPFPTDEDIRSALIHNVCRCATYPMIVRAVKHAAAIIAGRSTAASTRLGTEARGSLIGVSLERKDGIPKVRGELKYGDDISIGSMIYCKALRSEYPHAEVVSIDTSEAEKVPGVWAVFTARDIPGRNLFGQMVVDQPVLVGEGDKVRYIGDAVAAVYADSQEIAEEVLKKIRVEYRVLEGVFSPQRAMEADAPLVHEDGNTRRHMIIAKGDVEEAFKQADVIVEDDYYTPFIEQAFLEPESGLAMAREDGGVNVWVGSQFPWKDRSQVAATLGIPEEKVRIIHLPIGGAFGGKQDITVQILTALGAVKTQRPVKMVFSRKESLRVHPKRHAFYMHYKTGATKDGKLVAFEARIVGDTGAYASAGPGVLEHAAVHATGPYEIPNVKIESYAVYTNNVPGGAMRGFGPPQAHFAAELQMDALARKLQMDPFELRLLNGLEVGSVTAGGQLLESSVGYKETLKRCRKALGPIPETRPGKRIGVGLASGYVSSGYPLSFDDEAGAAVELTRNGTILLRVGCVDLGQGSDTVVAQIASDVLGIPYNQVSLLTGDTDETPFGHTTNGSRQTYVSGNAVLIASHKLKDVLCDFAATETDRDRESLELRNGRFIDADNGEILLTLAEVAERATREGRQLRADCQFIAPKLGTKAEGIETNFLDLTYADVFHYSYSYTSQVAVVEVDEVTGEVRVLRIIAAEDVGRAMNRASVEGQIVGSVIMGMGYALSEEFTVEKGWNLTDNLAKCHIPKIGDTPEVTCLIIEDIDPGGPFGAKGMGEVALLPTAPAIINAIYDAVGVRITSLPAIREKILAALRESRAHTGRPGSAEWR